MKRGADKHQRMLDRIWKLKEKRDVKGLIKALRYRDRGTVRSMAAEALGEIGGDPRAVKPLIHAALHDPDLSVRLSSIHALGPCGDRRAVKPLISFLKSRGRRDMALGDHPIIPVLYRTAARVLGEIGDPLAVDSLIAALDDNDTQLASAAVVALGKIRDPKAIIPLAKAFNKPDASKFVGEALAPFGLQALEPIMQSIGEPGYHEFWFKRSLQAIGHEDQVVTALVAALSSPDWSVPYRAALALKELGWPGEKTPEVWKAVVDGDYSRAISFGDEAIDPLISKLHESSQYEYARKGPAEALEEITGATMPSPLESDKFLTEWVNWREQHRG